MARHEPVLIAGGGIAGLALALALAQRGIPSHILEQRPGFSDAGAGIQIGPNGVRALEALGVARQLAPHASQPARLVVHSGQSGRVLTRMPLGQWMEDRHGAPYWVAHRQDLQSALLAGVRDQSCITIQTAFGVAAVRDHGDHVTASHADGRMVRGRALIGADGIRSVVRSVLNPEIQLQFSGKAASRALLPADQAHELGGPENMGVWLSPGAHVVHYPIRAGTQIALVAIVPDTRRTDDWAAPNDWATLAPHLAGFSPRLHTVLARAAEWRRWALFETPNLPRVAAGRIALMGDAAHPVLPFLAQGGVMALEDALVLAAAFAEHHDRPDVAFTKYAARRQKRVNAMVTTSRQNGRIFHLSGPAALARNLAMSALPAARLMARYDWVYSWRPPKVGHDH